MARSDRSRTWRPSAAVAAALVIGAACSGSSDKAGGEGDVDRVTLGFALGGAPTEEFVAFADDVARRTSGTVGVELHEMWAAGDPAYEAQIIADVESGTVDLAWVGVRALDQLGRNGFPALIAPMLIDSLDLQEAVFEAGITRDMLDGLPQDGIVALTVLPGPMRKVLGLDRAFVAPADFGAAIVGIQSSGVAELTMTALGATPRSLPAGSSLEWRDADGRRVALDAYDQQFGSIASNQYDRSARFVTANLNLWPRPFVIIMNRDTYDGLAPEQRQALQDAADALLPDAHERARADDREGAAELCRRGMTLAVASDDQLAALRAAVEPVYAELASDPLTAGYLDEITAIKNELGAPPDTAECVGQPAAPASEPTSESATVLDGVYEVTTTADDLAAAGDPIPIVENWGDWVYVFDRGRFAFTQENDQACTWAYGSYEVSGDRVAWTVLEGGAVDAPNNAFNRPGEHFVFSWELGGDTLTLGRVPGEISPENFMAKPWHRTSVTPDARALGDRCPPPSSTFAVESESRIPDGRYLRIATSADAERLGIDLGGPATAGLGADGEIAITFEIEGDRWTQFVTDNAGGVTVGDVGTATYDEDGRWVTVSETAGCPGCVLAFEWTLVDRTLTLKLVPTEFYVFDDGERFMTDGVYELER